MKAFSIKRFRPFGQYEGLRLVAFGKRHTSLTPRLHLSVFTAPMWKPFHAARCPGWVGFSFGVCSRKRLLAVVAPPIKYGG